MSRTLTAALIVSLLSTLPVRTSISKGPEDLEGSGYDLITSGYGSGDGSEQVSSEDDTIMDHPGTLWPDRDVRSGYTMVSNSMSFLENKQIVAGIIAGGITGLILAVMVMTILIYRWCNKDNGGYIQGQQKGNKMINSLHF
ncbi:syndecan-1-like [Paralichthys olivaceus]|uniref:syndecan-1-like n=1 Tax=Paralichthys olivaceus TaxID=8255 RepID=UPI0037520B7E